MKKIKLRKVKKLRNMEVVSMLLNCKGGPMKDRRFKRNKEPLKFRDEYGENF